MRSLVRSLIAIAVLCALCAAAPARPAAKRSVKKPPSAARSWMRSMTLHDKAAQLVFVAFYGEAPNARSQEYQKYLRWVRTLRVGGFVLVNKSRNGAIQYAEPFAMAAFLNRMQKSARVPLLVAGDFERGDSMRVVSETRFPHNMAFAATGDPKLSRLEGAITAKQGRALGVPWILAPVADVNNNPENPIINIRSYGENPETVAAHVRAFIEGAHSIEGDPVLVTVKHFPGHGDTATDTHIAMAVLNASRERLDAVELAPFRAAIAAGVDSIMTAHIAVPALDETGTPSTLSRPILTGLLREKLEFPGLITTDAMDMQGISRQWNSGQAAVKAIEAGVDVVLMPGNPEMAVDALVKAVQRGVISQARLDESVTRVLAAKAKLGLARKRLIDVEAALDELDSPEDIAQVEEVVNRAVTLVKNDGPALPLKAGRVCFLVLPEARCPREQGRLLASEARKRLPAATVLTLSPEMNDLDYEKTLAAAKEADVVVVAAFASVTSYRGSVALSGVYPKLIDALVAAEHPVVLAALGNPYLVRSFPKVAAYLTTYSTVPPSEAAAVRALFGEIAIGGRLPISIPGIAKAGDGIQLPQQAAPPKAPETAAPPVLQ